jgi:hypothetical protein
MFHLFHLFHLCHLRTNDGALFNGRVDSLTLCHFSSLFSHSFRFETGQYRTGTARTALWQLWNRSKGDLEGVHAQLLDERMLRREPLLQGTFFFVYQ